MTSDEKMAVEIQRILSVPDDEMRRLLSLIRDWMSDEYFRGNADGYDAASP